MNESTEDEKRICPDGGRCHHSCEKGCWRVRTCVPLSGVYPGDRWPASVTDVQPEETGGSL